MFKSVFLLLLCASFGFAQEASTAVRAARELAGAAKTGDMTWMVEKMYPQLKATLATAAGGEDKLKEQVRKAGESMKKSGFVCESFEVFDPQGEYEVKNRTEKVVLIPTRMVFSIPQGQQKIRMEKKGFLFAIAKKASPDTWYFIDGNMSLNQMRELFTDLPMNIKLPASSSKPLP